MFKVGSRVRYIKEDGNYGDINSLVLGKEYIVSHVCMGAIRIKDTFFPLWYRNRHFELVTTKKEIKEYGISKFIRSLDKTTKK